MSMISDETGREIVKALNRLAAAVEARDADVAPLRSAPRVPQWATGAPCNYCGGWHSGGMCPSLQPTTIFSITKA